MWNFRFLLFLCATSFFIPSSGISQNSDKLLCNRIFSFAFEHALIEKPIGEVVVAVGKKFLGMPYEANTLDRSDTEMLVVNLHSFDCVTFLENVLALARCIKSNHLSFDEYTNELQTIRYRGGKLDGYTSRLHYFSEWIQDGEKKGILHNITKEMGGVRYGKQINFMSTHRNSYSRLHSDSDYARIARIESELSLHPIFFLPKSKIQILQSKIQSGDLVAITTKQEGLDISHTGIAIRMEDGSLHYMHAPDVGDSVRITSETLSAYLQKHPAQAGIMVLRPIEPK